MPETPDVSAAQVRERANIGTKEPEGPHRFDPAALAAWMTTHVDSYDGPLAVRQFRGGQSNPTYQLRTPTANYVLRRKPPGKLLPSAHAVDREFRVISALYPTGFPVARPFALCTDDDVIGTWFYIMEMVEGRIFWDQSLPELAPAERSAVFRAQIGTLASLHNLDHAAIGLSRYGRPGNYMARQVDRWARQYKASETRHIDEMERLIAWLPTTVPHQDRTSVVHGDYRMDNRIFHPVEPHVVAVLYWELVTLGDSLVDFTYVLTNWINGPISLITDLAAHGIPTMEETIKQYCGLTGRSGIENLDWFFAYNFFRLAGITQGILGRVRDGTASHPDAANAEPRVAALAKLAWSYAVRAGAE